MKIKYDAEKLFQLISDFYRISGISITIIGKKRERVTHYIVDRQEFCCRLQENYSCLCKNSDTQIIEECNKTRKPAMHVCHAGLLDATLPIIVEDEVVGYITMGQVRKCTDYASIEKRIPQELRAELKEHFYKLPLCSEDQLESAIRIVNAIITKIVKENMIEITTEELSILAEKYIEENLAEDLSVEKLCRHLNISKNRLYECFHLCFNSTVNEYIVKKRVEKAIDLLENSELSIDEVAKETGFSDSSYFYRVFKKETGKTPKNFKKT